MALEALAPEVLFAQGVSLDHRAHGAVEDEDALLQRCEQAVPALFVIHDRASDGRTPSAWQIANASSERLSV